MSLSYYYIIIIIHLLLFIINIIRCQFWKTKCVRNFIFSFLFTTKCRRLIQRGNIWQGRYKEIIVNCGPDHYEILR